MKKYLLAMANYNMQANLYIAKLLSGITADELDKDRGSFAKSIRGLYQHIAEADAFFLDIMAKQLPKHDIKHFEVSKNAGFTEVAAIIEAIDKEFIRLLSELDESELETTFDFFGQPSTIAGSVVRWSSQALHHRGQLSQIFDSMHIEHDLMRAPSPK
jgi:uncharacterized damage-inducible protein DinB